MTQREGDRFQRTGLLAFVGLFSALCMLFGPLRRDDAAAAAPAAAPAAPAAPAAVGAGYRLGAGDAVRIRVLQDPEFTLEVRIGATGWVSHPALGEVQIGGMTVVAAEAAIAAGLRGRTMPGAPKVSVVVVDTVGGKPSALHHRDGHVAAHFGAGDPPLSANPSRIGKVVKGLKKIFKNPF